MISGSLINPAMIMAKRESRTIHKEDSKISSSIGNSGVKINKRGTNSSLHCPIYLISAKERRRNNGYENNLICFNK